ncbi:MAG: DUF5024 domain-containing protein [Bacteroidaceae bacterium]|nr:DUF5024 domain-containing protein [Bacteroidaceae bacterium]
MKQRLLILLTLALASMTAAAQNRIDRFVDNESTLGRSKYTSVVERDPDTREVTRVVKVRELTEGIDISKCKEIFEAERETGRFTHKVEDGERHTLILAVEGEQRNRVYMLQYTGQRPMQARDGKVTIVIRMKNK